MGGVGSGCSRTGKAKATCESRKRIDLAYLKKAGMLRPGFRGTLSWTCRGKPDGWINVATHGHCLELNYRQRAHGGSDWTSVNERVAFERTPVHFGGLRTWFRCPSCGRRCSILYGGGYFRCRRCHDLAYQSQQEDACGRALCQAQKIRARLGDYGSVDETFPVKPKGMHWRTNERLRLRCEALEAIVDQRLAMYAAWLLSMFRKIGCNRSCFGKH